MRDFNRAISLSGLGLAASATLLGIGEYSNSVYNHDIRACETLGQKAVIEQCKSDVGPDPDNTYGVFVYAFGAAGVFMGVKAYKLHEAQVKRDENYRKAEGIDII